MSENPELDLNNCWAWLLLDHVARRLFFGELSTQYEANHRFSKFLQVQCLSSKAVLETRRKRLPPNGDV